MYVGDLGFNLSTFPFTTASPRTGVEPTPNFVSSNLFGGRGTTSAISANEETNGILWDNDVTQSGTDYLAAYTASATGSSINPIYTTNQNSSRDSLTGGVTNGTGVKFSIPTVFNGMVYDGTGGGSGTGGHIQGTVVGYGLLSTAYSKGDINLDGHVDAADIMPLMQALTNPTGYEAQYGVSAANLQVIGDVNGDGHFNNADVQALLNLLITGGGSTSAESQSGAIASTGTPEANTSSPAIATIITSSPTDDNSTAAPAASVVVQAAEATSSSAVESVASNASDPAAAPITYPGSPSVTASAPPVASVPVPMQLNLESDPIALPTSDSDTATTLPGSETVATANFPEAVHESLFVGAFEKLGPKPVSPSSSQNMSSPWPQHLLPTAVDQVLLTPELDRGRLLHWHGEKRVDDDTFADDSLAGLFAQWSQWQA